MYKLETLVPPLELCKQIPEGAFIDSAFAWLYSDVAGFVCRVTGCEELSGKQWQIVHCNAGRICRALKRGDQIFPAPTLQEIIEALPHDDVYNDLLLNYCGKVDKLTGWHIYYSGDRKRHCYDANAASAALQLWLKINIHDDQFRDLAKLMETKPCRG